MTRLGTREERPTSWGLRAMLKAAIADLEAGRRPEFVVADLLAALKEMGT